MLRYSFDVDHEIAMNSSLLSLECTDFKTGDLDWALYSRRQEEIIKAAWAKKGEYMRLEMASLVEDAEVQAGIERRRLEYESQLASRVPGSPYFLILIILSIYLAILLNWN